jgi:hypothetical protein
MTPDSKDEKSNDKMRQQILQMKGGKREREREEGREARNWGCIFSFALLHDVIFLLLLK